MTARIALVVSALAAAGLFAGCGDDKTVDVGGGPGTTSTAQAPPATGDAAEITQCLDSGQPDPGTKPTFSKPEQVLKEGVPATIVMKTSCGTLNIALDEKAGGPIPNSIAFLASKGFYDGLTFHRVVPEFVLQGGDPNGNGSGDAGYEVVGAPPEGYQYKLGDVAMAKTGDAAPGTSGSQFFVVSGPQGESVLTSQPVYGILGHAADAVSLATIQRIAALAVGDGPPNKPVWIISATVKTGS